MGSEGLWKTSIEGLTWAIILGVAWAGVIAVSPWQTSRYLMAKNEHVVIRSVFTSGLVILLLYLLLVTIGSAIAVINPNLVGEKVFVWSAFNVLPTWLGILVLGGILAAALSSASTFLSLVGFSVTRDLMGNMVLMINNSYVLTE